MQQDMTNSHSKTLVPGAYGPPSTGREEAAVSASADRKFGDSAILFIGDGGGGDDDGDGQDQPDFSTLQE